MRWSTDCTRLVIQSTPPPMICLSCSQADRIASTPLLSIVNGKVIAAPTMRPKVRPASAVLNSSPRAICTGSKSRVNHCHAALTARAFNASVRADLKGSIAPDATEQLHASVALTIRF
jgi:hypothetical protein